MPNSDAYPPDRDSESTEVDRALIDRLRDRDSSAWERVDKLLSALVYHRCRKYELPPDVAADITQDVLLAAYDHLNKFRLAKPTDTFLGWVSRIAQNKIHDHFRRIAREPSARAGAETDLPDRQHVETCRADVVEDFHMSPKCLVMREALEDIRPNYEQSTWQAFWRTAVDGRPAPEIAAELGKTDMAVRQAKARVLRELRRQVECRMTELETLL